MCETRSALDRRRSHHIRTEAIVIFRIEGQAVFPETEIKSDLGILSLLPAQIRVRRRRDGAEVESLITEIAVLLLKVLDYKQMRSAGIDITGKSVSSSQCRVRQGRQCFFYPSLLSDMPCRTCAPCRVELLVASEVRAAVSSERSIQDNALAQVVIG